MNVDELRAACKQNPEAFAEIINHDLFTMRQLAALFRVKLSTASMQVWRHKGPAHAGKVGIQRVWTRWDVEAFIAANPKTIRHHDDVETEAS